MKLSEGNVLNLKRGEIKVFFGEITLDHDDTIRAWINCPGKAECISNEGQNYLGEWFDKLDKCAKANEPKRLWFYVKAPDTAGKYNGTITVTNTARKVFSKLTLTLNVSEEAYEGDNFANPDDLSRLFWLNSKLAINSEVPKPYVPVERNGKKVKILGREIELDEFGLPKSIISHFDKDINISSKSYEVLSGKIKFTVGSERFKIISSGELLDADAYSFASVSESESFMMKIRARIEFDGFCDYKITLIAKRDAKLSNVNLSLPINEYCRKYFAGLGNTGGEFKNELDFKWGADKNQDSFFIGAENAGIRVKFKDGNYRKPVTCGLYKHRPLNMPETWDNAGRGGIRYENGSFEAYSGEIEVPYGKKLSFDFDFLITPIKPAFKNTHSDNEITISEGHELNPVLNNPFAKEAELSSFVEKAHSKGKRVSIAYSFGALGESAPEFKPFKDFDSELLLPTFEELKNAAIANGCSRIANFYVEALKRLFEVHKIDGVVLVGTEFDRNTLKRIRRVLDGNGAKLELKLENQFTKEAGYASTVLSFADLLPYADKVTLSDGVAEDLFNSFGASL